MGQVIFNKSLSGLKRLLKDYQSVFLVYDINVEEYADKIAGDADIQCSMSIETGEENKTIETVLDIERFLLALGADRDSLVLAVGGGVTTDLVGFAASIYKRGIRFGLVPTSLLSQVDAAIGGKTAANLDSYKNMIGTFAEAEFTYICSECLRTLLEREFRSGAAEMLKSFIISGGPDYEKAVDFLKRWNLHRKWTVKELGELVEAAAKVKMEIVAKDPFEKGIRRKLNLGHTFAHAIEWYEQTNGVTEPLTHGEAVAVGIVQAARLTDDTLADKFAEDFAACGLPVELPYGIDVLMPAMEKDKKNRNGGIKFVLVYKIGDVR
ncbi:MAG: 3-dehydroquinate synthase [Bacteroidales bacterium]|nr:3-dehydroquinate synthase [Bacteroidales bacterium]